MGHEPHDLELAVLKCGQSGVWHRQEDLATNLEPLVLQHLLDSNLFAIGYELGLVDDAKGAIADDLVIGVGYFSGGAGLAIAGRDCCDPRRVVKRC